MFSPEMNPPPPLFREEEHPFTLQPRLHYRGSVPPGGLETDAQHSFFTWWWIESGRAVIHTRGARYKLRPGMWYLHPPGLWRQQSISPDTRLISLNFTAQWATGRPLWELRQPLALDGRKDGELRERAAAFCRASRTDPQARSPSTRPDSVAAACQIQRQLWDFMAALSVRLEALGIGPPPCTHGDPRLDEALLRLRQKPLAGPAVLRENAAAVGLSRSRLDGICREHLKQSLSGVRDEILISEIRQRLAVENAPVKALASRFGFVDASHFCRWVKRSTGKSPGALRRTPLT